MHIDAYDEISMALTIFREAGGEPETGKVGVAHVILNRVKDGRRWPNSIPGVVFCARYPARPDHVKPNRERRIWHFSCFDPADPNASKWPKSDDLVWIQCRKIARDVIDGAIPDPTNGANHYESLPDDREPSWADPSRKTAVIGGHEFYRL